MRIDLKDPVAVNYQYPQRGEYGYSIELYKDTTKEHPLYVGQPQEGTWVHVVSPINLQYDTVEEIKRKLLNTLTARGEICVSDYNQGLWFGWGPNKLALEFVGPAEAAFSSDVWSKTDWEGKRVIPDAGQEGAGRLEAWVDTRKVTPTKIIVHPNIYEGNLVKVETAAHELGIEVSPSHFGEWHYKIPIESFDSADWPALLEVGAVKKNGMVLLTTTQIMNISGVSILYKDSYLNILQGYNDDFKVFSEEALSRAFFNTRYEKRIFYEEGDSGPLFFLLPGEEEDLNAELLHTLETASS